MSTYVDDPTPAQTKSPRQVQMEQALDALAAVGGKGFTEEDVIFRGQQIVLPENMNLKDAVKFLHIKLEEDEQDMSFSRIFQFRPWDGAHAAAAAFKKAFGMMAQKETMGFFGPNPPEQRSIPTDVNENVSVPWGAMELPHMPGMRIFLTATRDREMGELFAIEAVGPRKYRFHVEGLFNLVDAELKSNSIYRGKAFDGQAMPNFIDLSGVSPDKVIYSQEVMTQLDANVWSLIRYSDKMRSLGVPLKRAVLFEGPYGTGKTMGAFLTAKIAKENGWTFIMCRPGKDNLNDVMNTARLYQPAVVFFEDVDVVSGADKNADQVSALLDAFDGIASKGTEIVCVLTTNHRDRIHKGMMRPGRLDAVIHIGALDHAGIEKLAKATVPNELLSDQIDWEKVGVSMEGFMPAFAREAIDRSLRYAISRTGGETQVLETIDFVSAADGLRPQLELMEGAHEGKPNDPLATALQEVVRSTMDGAEFVDSDGDPRFELRTVEPNSATSRR